MNLEEKEKPQERGDVLSIDMEIDGVHIHQEVEKDEDGNTVSVKTTVRGKEVGKDGK